MTVPLSSVEAEVVALSNRLREPRERYFAEPDPFVDDPDAWPDLVGGEAAPPRPFAARLRQARILTAATRPGLLRPLRVARAALSHAAWATWGRMRTSLVVVTRAACSSKAGLWCAQALALLLCWVVWRQPRGNGHRLAAGYVEQLKSARYRQPCWPSTDDDDAEVD